MRNYSDEEKELFLISLMKDYYSQGDNYFAYKNRKGIWTFGYINDYPMQHGSGESFKIPDEMCVLIMLKIVK